MTDTPSIDSKYTNPQLGSEILELLPLFQGFSKPELMRIYSLGSICLYRKQTNIIIEGETSRGLFILLDGAASVFKTLDRPDSACRIATLEPKAAFGEISLLSNEPRNATVAAETQVIVFHLEGKIFLRYLDSNLALKARFFENCAQVLARRLRELDDAFILSQRQLWKLALSRDNNMENKHARTA